MSDLVRQGESLTHGVERLVWVAEQPEDMRLISQTLNPRILDEGVKAIHRVVTSAKECGTLLEMDARCSQLTKIVQDHAEPEMGIEEERGVLHLLREA